MTSRPTTHNLIDDEESRRPSWNVRTGVQVPPMNALALAVMAVASGWRIRRSAVMA